MELKTLERISIKNHPEINEDAIQKFIFDNPAVLGLGDLTPLQRERVQPSGGRIDILLIDDDSNRYEVEIQIGATHIRHIIIINEYNDNDKK